MTSALVLFHNVAVYATFASLIFLLLTVFIFLTPLVNLYTAIFTDIPDKQEIMFNGGIAVIISMIAIIVSNILLKSPLTDFFPI